MSDEPKGLRDLRAALDRECERRRAAEAAAADVPLLRRQVALWRAGIKYGPAAELFLSELGDDMDLDDTDAVRQACAALTAAVLDGRAQLEEVAT
jgi:hypothetical protein